MTHPETTALRLAEAATPGPWEAGEDPWHRPVVLAPSPTGGDAVLAEVDTDANARHIAHAHPGRVRAWLGAVARLRERAAEGHSSECTAERFARRLTGMGHGACTCGHEDDLAALAAVDAEG